jgi:hypothetical protein
MLMNPTKVGFAQPGMLLMESRIVSFQKERAAREKDEITKRPTTDITS